jgi:hypothetical protein
MLQIVALVCMLTVQRCGSDVPVIVRIAAWLQISRLKQGQAC